MHNKLITAATILLMYVFCPFQLLSQDGIKIYTDPENAPGIKASKFIDSIDFIPLETTKESKYDNYYWFIVGKNHFAMMDNANNAVFIFDKQGHFVYKFKNEKSRFKINSLQYVPSENAILIISYNKNYTISNSKKQQLVKRWEGKDISKYVSVEWVYLNKEITRKKVFAPSYVLNNNITYFDSGFIYRNYSYDKYDKDSVAYRLVQYGPDYKVKHKYFPFLNLPKLWSSYADYVLALPVCSTPNENTMLFQLDFSPILYELKPDTLVERYRFVFPMANVMPSDFSSLRFNNNIDFEKYKEKNNKAISYFRDMIEHGKYLIFGTATPAYSFKRFLLMDNMVYSLDKLTSDSSICNLPPNLFNSISRQDKDYVYTITDAETILQQKTNLLADPHVSPAFKAHLNKMTKNDNHIIIRVKLK
ncbi:MAG: hypothetical protein DI598_02770 [Pseudopedobacter saltans]|uniref:6-bladed beta-propeller n=1 Tax=Pseudopedobacter saltans TaxID=151895 RepID=A0A2W5FBK2_9SPHI|nr:MAG: hypothetical protein DI598_02770 [Pseudopedobacter saltans]